jgi:hypothetical protein
MFRVNLDMQYGIRRQDDRCVVKIHDAITPPATFMGIPVLFSEYITQERVFRKRWKRLGRPNKVRTRYKQVPSYMIMDGKVIMHPDLERQLPKGE